jgi:DNA repair protein RecO (recombination protein O)
MLTKDEAVCTRAVDYSETSQILTLFCRETGKTGVMAKGSRRPKSSFGGPLEVFSHGRVVLTGNPESRLLILVEFEQRGDFALLRRRLCTLNCALFGVELVNALISERDPQPEAFDDFVNFLQGLQETCGDGDAMRLLILFQLSFLGRLGLAPSITRCAGCGADHDAGRPALAFSSSAGGFLCTACEGRYPDRIAVAGGVAASLKNLKSVASLSAERLAEMEKLLICHLTWLMHHPPRMGGYFLSI